MNETYYYGMRANDEGALVDPIRLRLRGDGGWERIDADGVWRCDDGLAGLARDSLSAGLISVVSAERMAKALWAATADGAFSEIPAEPRLDSYEPDWQYCVLRPIDVGTRTSRDAVFAESDAIVFSEIWFGRYNRNHYDATNFQVLHHDDGRWVDSDVRFVLLARGDGRDELLDLPAAAVGRLIDRAVACGRAVKPIEPPVAG